MDVVSFKRIFYVPLVLHTISVDERAFLHCTSSVMLHILSFYTAELLPLHHRETPVLSASSGPIANCCSEQRGGMLTTIADRVHVVQQHLFPFYSVCHYRCISCSIISIVIFL